MNDRETDRQHFAAMLHEAEVVVTQIRTGILGARFGVIRGGWTDKELRAIEERAVHLEFLLGKFQADLHGVDYVVPAFEGNLNQPQSGKIQ